LCPFSVADNQRKATFADILGFTSGLKQVPPLGFNPPLSVTFRHKDERHPPNQKLLATSNTCGNQLILPVDLAIRKYKKYGDALDLAFSEGCEGFGEESAIFLN